MGLTAGGGRRVDTRGAGRAVCTASTVATVAPYQAAATAIAAALPERGCVATVSAVAEEPRTAADASVRAVSAVTPQQPAVAAVACAPNAIGGSVEAISEQSQNGTGPCSGRSGRQRVDSRRLDICADLTRRTVGTALRTHREHTSGKRREWLRDRGRSGRGGCEKNACADCGRPGKPDRDD